MPRNVGVAVENSFIRGRVSQSTRLNTPENAVTSDANCIFDETGVVSRRLGFDYETSYSTQTVSRSSSYINTYVWENVAGNGNIEFKVVQIGAVLYFYQSGENNSLSAGLKSFTVNLFSYKTAGSSDVDVKSNFCDFAAGQGLLYVVHPHCEPFSVRYDATTDTITPAVIAIKVRDTSGLDDGLEVDERPLTLSTDHKYNLFNQGWNFKHPANNPVLDAWSLNEGAGPVYPSNADVWWAYKNTSDAFSNAVIKLVDRGSTEAPRGGFILDAFNQDRATVSGVVGVATVSTRFRPSSVAFFAGRVFYAGVDDDGFVGRIYFSQIVIDDTRVGKCYQKNDPTSESLFDLLDDDGGVIVRPEIGSVIKLVALRNFLLVFSVTGIWAISGSDNASFRATDYIIQPVSTVEAISKRSFTIIRERGTPIFWAKDGIYVLETDQTGFSVNAQSLTDQTIKPDYISILDSSKSLSVGAYDSTNKVCLWLYRSTEATDVDDSFDYDRVLCLNVLSGAFYFWTLDNSLSTTPRLNGILFNDAAGVTTTTSNVVVGGDSVVVGANDVVTNDLTTVETNIRLKFLTSKFTSGTNFAFTFSETRDETFYDWTTPLGSGKISYTSNFVTAPKIRGSAVNTFDVPYLTIYSNVQTGSGFKLRGRWDHTNTGNSGKWSSQQQGYKHDAERDVTSRRLLIRGNGKSLQLAVDSEVGKPFNIIGWSEFVTVGDAP